VPVLEALAGVRERRLVVQVPNRGADPRLAPDQTIEVPAWVGRDAVEPEQPSPLPPDCRALLEQCAAYDALVVEAVLERDRAKARRALALNPLVGTVRNADAVLGAAWPSPSRTQGEPRVHSA
jgi:6-phospho-beta-glucosidase